MATALVVITFLALCHFAYESIFVPTMRAGIRSELFALKEELREFERRLDPRAFQKQLHYVKNSIENLLQRGERLDLCTFFTVINDLEKNKELQAHLLERCRELDNSRSPEIKTSWEKAYTLAGKLLTVNMGGWFFLVVPIAMPFVFIHAMHEKAKALLSLPPSDNDKDPSDTGRMHAAV